MKGISVARAHPLYADSKAKLKYKTLLRDYEDLQKEVFDMRNRLEAAKGSKKRLLTEVRFLGRRYTYLLQTKSLNQQQQQEQSREIGFQIQSKLSKVVKNSRKKEAGGQFKLPPLPDLKHKGRVYAGKEGALRNTTMKEASFFTPSPLSNKNYKKKRLSSENDTSTTVQNVNNHGGISNGIPGFDLNQDTSLVRKEAKMHNQAPTFDLNEISMDEEVEI